MMWLQAHVGVDWCCLSEWKIIGRGLLNIRIDLSSIAAASSGIGGHME